MLGCPTDMHTTQQTGHANTQQQQQQLLQANRCKQTALTAAAAAAAHPHLADARHHAHFLGCGLPWHAGQLPAQLLQALVALALVAHHAGCDQVLPAVDAAPAQSDIDTQLTGTRMGGTRRQVLDSQHMWSCMTNYSKSSASQHRAKEAAQGAVDTVRQQLLVAPHLQTGVMWSSVSSFADPQYLRSSSSSSTSTTSVSRAEGTLPLSTPTPSRGKPSQHEPLLTRPTAHAHLSVCRDTPIYQNTRDTLTGSGSGRAA
jgi:hypothetical protein